MKNLAKETFPSATLADWDTRVRAVMKDEAGYERLIHKSADGFAMLPLYTSDYGPRAERSRLSPWQIFQRVDHPQASSANGQALIEIKGGSDGLTLVAKQSLNAYGQGLRDVSNIEEVLRGIALHTTPIRLEGDEALAESFAQYVARQPIDPSRLSVSFGLKSAALVPTLSSQGFTGPFITADGRDFHNGGATAGQELGCVIAQAVSALRSQTSLSPRAGAQTIGFTLAANQDMFMTLAKFRSLRLLWQRVLLLSGVADAAPLVLHGETSYRMMAELDPHTNILRATTAMFGACLGGADSFSVLPFSIRQGLPDAFSRRVARNGQLILRDEADLWRVSDPASGSGYVESLTDNLSKTAWEIFQTIESTGEYPHFDAANSDSQALIGTQVYRLSEEFAAAIEVTHG